MSCSAPASHDCVGKTCAGCEWLLPKIPALEAGNFTIEELLALHKSTTDACREVMRVKNHDYTCAGGVFDNFKASTVLGVHPVIGILMRTMDKFKRIQTFITKGTLAVDGEGVLDAVDDSINYLILIKGIIIEEQRMGNNLGK